MEQLITRFHGEMLFSHAVRLERLATSPSNTRFPDSRYYRPRSHSPWSCRLPLPQLPKVKGKENTKYTASEEVYKAYEEATAWPISCLLRGRNVCDLFLMPSIFRSRLGLQWDINPEDNLRFCRQCALEQRQLYSISWWMRDLNLPMVAVCPVHHLPLDYLPRISVIKSRALPHELMGSSRQIVGSVDDAAVRIAESVIELCRSYAVLNKESVRDWLMQESAIFRGKPPFFFKARLGIVASILHPAILGNYSKKHDGLTRLGNEDFALLTLTLPEFESPR